MRSKCLANRERFRKVSGTAGAEAGDAIRERASGCEEQDRRLYALGPEGLADVAAVAVGKADIDDQQVGRRLLDVLEELAARCDAARREALLREAADQRCTHVGGGLRHDDLGLDQPPRKASPPRPAGAARSGAVQKSRS